MVTDYAVLLAGLALIGIELARSLPAYLRVRFSASSDGISASSLGILAGTGIGWIILAVSVNAWWILAANAIWLSLHVMLCREVMRATPEKRRHLVLYTGGSTVILALTVAIGSLFLPVKDALSVMLGISVIFYAVPALYEGLRSKTTRGLSLMALFVNTLEGIVYLLAGFSIIHLSSSSSPVLGFVIFGGVSALSNGARLMRVSYRRCLHLDDEE